MPFASGKDALGICDYCGFTYPFKELKEFIFNQVNTGLKLCPVCWTPDQPQLQVGKANQSPEAVALYKARPDTGIPGCRGFARWAPVISLTMQLTMNAVTANTGD